MYPRLQIRIHILLRDHFQRKQVQVWRFLFKDEVIGEVAYGEERLPFRILVDQEINRALSEIFKVFFQNIVSNQPNVLFASFFKAGGYH